jgi:7-cyano-7-deazaguanine synthase
MGLLAEKRIIMKAMVILSGGQDSTISLYWAKSVKIFDEVHAITFDYGQKHSREIIAASKIAQMAGCASHSVVNCFNLLKSTSPLTNATIELEQYDSYERMDSIIGNRIELTFVPMRNSLFLTVASNHALSKNCRTLVTGVCQADNANYPDCTESFIALQKKTINASLGTNDFEIYTPLMNLSKRESIEMAIELDGCMDALAYTHTSYDNQYPPTGKDHATILRAQGFLDANVPDPLIVRAWREGLMGLPNTSNYHEVTK